jgi:YD repeat-containing protein
VGRDYFDVGPRERLFDSPSVIARVVRSTKYARRLVVSADDSFDLNERPLSWHWVVLRGDSDAVQINLLNEKGSVAELMVPYRRPVRPDSNLQSNRVDIGAFVHNGEYYSAPAFVTFFYLDNEIRVYGERKLIRSVTYTDPESGGNYVDPAIDLPKNWRDEYRYDEMHRLIGWTRYRGQQSQEFTADGALVIAKDSLGRAKQARTVRYVANGGRTKTPVLEQRPGEEILDYEYDSSDDRVGRVRGRAKVAARR